MSRLSREYFDLAWLRKWAEQNRKKLYVIKERLHWPDNRDGTLWGVAAERAYEERQEIIERVTRELEALEEAGKLIGRPPFGYASAGEKYDRYLAPTDEGRTYVPLVYRHCIEGWSLNTIAEWLIAEEVRPVSGAWGPRSIAGLIKNPVYKGHRCKREAIPPDETEEREGKVIRYRYGSTWVETPRWQYGRTVHRCEPLVDAATWKRANEALATRTKRGHVDPEDRAMLAEALFCPFCEDSPMYRHRATAGAVLTSTTAVPGGAGNADPAATWSGWNSWTRRSTRSWPARSTCRSCSTRSSTETRPRSRPSLSASSSS